MSRRRVTDDKPRAQYIDDMVALFRLLERRLVPHGVVVVNLSYGARDTLLPERWSSCSGALNMCWWTRSPERSHAQCRSRSAPRG